MSLLFPIYDMDAALDCSTALDITQEYNIGELMAIAPITTATENINYGIVAPHSKQSSAKTSDLASVHSQSSDIPIVSDSAESDTPKYKKIYYYCLTPQEDNIIYIHYCDIISRPCAVKLFKMTQQEIDMFTSIKDTNMSLSHPKHKRTKTDYSGLESNEETEPKAKNQTVTRPGREPSALRIAARKLLMSSRRKKLNIHADSKKH